MTLKTLKIRQPDDFHVHLRQGGMLEDLVLLAARQFGRVTVMPNTVPPIRTFNQGMKYREEILACIALPASAETFQPMMTLFLTDETDPDDLKRAAESPHFIGAKLYPKGATTNSESGITCIRRKAYPLMEVMQEYGLPLLIHGEVTDDDVDFFEREVMFVEEYLRQFYDDFQDLRMVLEHITMGSSAAFVSSKWRHEQNLKRPRPRLAATITAHHLFINSNDILVGGMKPHLYCLPIAKREGDRKCLVECATSGEACFFAGTDSAPHARGKKECDCCAAGIFTSPHAVELYVTAFERNAIAECGVFDAESFSNMEKFLSVNGAKFFGLPRNESVIRLERITSQIPAAVGRGDVVPFMAGQTLPWRQTPDWPVFDAEMLNPPDSVSD